MRTNREKGKIGEARAKEFYESRGFTLVAQNYFCRWGEIDLIVKNEVFFVFCEVKLRRGAAFGGGLSAVTLRKREKIIKSAQEYLQKHPVDSNLQPRFDVFEVQIAQKNDTILVKSTELVENAFEVEERHV